MVDPTPIPIRPRSRPEAPPAHQPGLAWPEVVRALRTARGLTQDGWAAQLGLSDVTVRRWERGAAVPTAQAEAALLAWCRHHGLFRGYDSGALRGVTLTPEALTELLAEARLAARPQRAVETPLAPAPAADIPARMEEALSPGRLPVSPTRLIGRDRDLQRICTLVRTGGARLITLTGAGGSGKTRLALEAAHALDPTLAGGVSVVRLEALRDPDLVLPAVAAGLEVSDTGARPLLEQVRDRLSGQASLLVLDNFEQILAAAPLVADLLAACPSLTVLVTSRTPLRLSSEHEIVVAPLDPALALHLFTERAAAVQPDFRLTEATTPVAADICARLDGLPLAIELAAVWVKVLPLVNLRERLTPALSRRAPRPGDRPARHQTLVDTVSWSYDLLDGQEQVMFRRLAVFAGGWTLAAAEAICADDRLAGEDVLLLLAQLVDQSLVVADFAGPEPRYRFLETIGSFAAEKLARSDEGALLGNRHRAWFLALAERESGSGASGLDALAQEHDNLRRALAWRDGDSTDPEIRLRLVAALWRFWQMRGHLVEGRRWLEDALAGGEAAPLALRARALNGLGSIAYYQADMRAAARYYGEALAARRALGDQRGALTALTNQAMAAFTLGDTSNAGAWWEEAVAMARELGDKRSVAQSLSGLSLKAQHELDHDRARALLEEAHALWQEIGDEIWLGRSAGNIGAVAYFQGDYEGAIQHCTEALAISRRVGNRRNASMALHYLAKSHYGRRAYDTAHQLHQEAIAIFRALGDGVGLAISLEGEAMLAAVTGRPERAARLFGAAALLREQRSTPPATYMGREYEAAIATGRSRLNNDSAWAAAWQQGRAWTLDEALAAAMGE